MRWRIRWQGYRVSASRLAESNFRYTQVPVTLRSALVTIAGALAGALSGTPRSRFLCAAFRQVSPQYRAVERRGVNPSPQLGQSAVLAGAFMMPRHRRSER